MDGGRGTRLFLAVLALGGLLAGQLAACASRPPAAPPEPPVGHESGLLAPARDSLRAAGSPPEYRLALALDAAARRLTGQEQVRFSNRTGIALDEIVFRLYPNLPQYGGRLTAGRVWIDGKRVTPSMRASDTSLAVPLPRTLAPNATTTISLTFELAIPEKEEGYDLFSLSQGMWSVPDGYALLAVHDGSRWHEDIAPAHGDAVFAEPARYDVSLELPRDLTLATTGEIVSQTRQADGSRVYWISGDGLREFAWFASADYAVAESQAGNTRILSYYLRGDEAQGQAALAVGAAALGVYGDGFGAYPFTTVKIVQGPIAYFGMEYPGLNLIGMQLYRELHDQFELRLAHEIAHQWWYAQVGNDQVNAPWLDEGLAEFSTGIYYEQVYGQAQANTLINQRWQVPYEVAVDSGIDAVVDQPAAAFGLNYEVIVYAKAALFFQALRQQLGDDTFYSFLHAYVNQYLWRTATPDDLLAIAEKASGQQLDELYTGWILSKQ